MNISVGRNFSQRPKNFRPTSFLPIRYTFSALGAPCVVVAFLLLYDMDVPVVLEHSVEHTTTFVSASVPLLYCFTEGHIKFSCKILCSVWKRIRGGREVRTTSVSSSGSGVWLMRFNSFCEEFYLPFCDRRY